VKAARSLTSQSAWEVFMSSRLRLLTWIAVVAAPGMAFAQPNQPVRNGQISPETSATSGPAADQNPNTPGATGDARVEGDPSTVAGDKRATTEQRTGQGAESGGD
jgi:hypothetical protein